MYRLLEEHARAFRRDGYFVVEGLLLPQEVALLTEIARRVHARDPQGRDKHDAQGRATHLSLRNELSGDAFSATVRCARIAVTMQRLLGDEVYHYHHKLMVKEARTGGAWEWHQDYGYWYGNGCLAPDMASCMLALTPSTVANGCLQVVPRSQRLGRIDHGLVGDQTGADPQRVSWILQRYPPVHVELAPGSALFFHANLLHRSDGNTSDEPRISLIDCYNTRGNDPCIEHHHPRYSPMEIWPDERVAARARAQLAALRASST